MSEGKEAYGTSGTEGTGPEKKSQRNKRKHFLRGGKGERIKCVSCVKSGDLQGKAGLKLCLGCCASRS